MIFWLEMPLARALERLHMREVHMPRREIQRCHTGHGEAVALFNDTGYNTGLAIVQITTSS